LSQLSIGGEDGGLVVLCCQTSPLASAPSAETGRTRTETRGMRLALRLDLDVDGRADVPR
jgi:hypothetical protein